MATGTLGQSNPASATNTTVYTVPVGKTGTFNVNILNTSGGPTTVRLAIASTGTPALSEYLEYDTIVEGHGVLERGGIVASAGERVVVYAGSNAVAVNVYGYEE